MNKLNKTNLTTEQLQSLKSLLKDQISSLSNGIIVSKMICQELYQAADKSDEVNGEFYFSVLNKTRNDIRKDKKRLKVLVDIQKSVKKDLVRKSIPTFGQFFDGIFG